MKKLFLLIGGLILLGFVLIGIGYFFPGNSLKSILVKADIHDRKYLIERKKIDKELVDLEAPTYNYFDIVFRSPWGKGQEEKNSKNSVWLIFNEDLAQEAERRVMISPGVGSIINLIQTEYPDQYVNITRYFKKDFSDYEFEKLMLETDSGKIGIFTPRKKAQAYASLNSLRSFFILCQDSSKIEDYDQDNFKVLAYYCSSRNNVNTVFLEIFDQQGAYFGEIRVGSKIEDIKESEILKIISSLILLTEENI